MFSHDDDQEELVIGEAALNLVTAGQVINQVSLLKELGSMASNANDAVRKEVVNRAICLLERLSSAHSRDKTVLTWMMASLSDDDGKHH